MGEKFDPKSHIGEVHGIYTIVEMLDKKDKYGHWIYKCVCSKCGFEKLAHYGGISASHTATECKHLRQNGEYIVYGYKWKNKRIGKIFQGMFSRCYDTKDKNYRWYGEKGIGICKEWRDNPKLFEEWALKNGYNDDLTIDRIKSEQDYGPENCQWISLEENSRRAGKVTWIELDGKKMTGRQWADYLKIGTNTINKTIRQYSLDKAKELILAMLKEPPSTKYRKSNQSWFDVYGIQT